MGDGKEWAGEEKVMRRGDEFGNCLEKWEWLMKVVNPGSDGRVVESGVPVITCLGDRIV